MLKKEVKLLDGPLSCLSENVNFTQLAVGGRNVFKIFDCQKQSFEEVANLRNGISPQVHLSINDVNWCKADEKTLVSASIQGAVVIWDMSSSGQAKQVFVFSEHQRSVNCLEFLPNSSNLLMAASQDGSCRVIDLRKHESTITYGPSVESPAREVKFNPRNTTQFSAAFENGFCQLWDMRNSSNYLRHWVAHSGPCVCMDWHHTQNWLITGGRDKTAAVWDFSDSTKKLNYKYSAETVASIGKVKWRPNYKYQVLVTPMLTESHASVWDVRRPYLADVYFVEHKDSIGDVIWKNEEIFYTCGRDSKLCRFIYREHKDMRESFYPVCVSTNIYGSLVHCSNEKALYCPAKKALDGGGTDADESDNVLTQSSVTSEYIIKCLSMDAFLAMAKAYKLSNDSFSNLCTHNSQVATKAGMHQIATTWSMLKLMFEEVVVKETASRKISKMETKAIAFADGVFSKLDDKTSMKMPSAPSTNDTDSELEHNLIRSNSYFSDQFNFSNELDIFDNDIIEESNDDKYDYDERQYTIEKDLTFPKDSDWSGKLSDIANSTTFHDDSESPTTDYSTFNHSRRIEVQEVVKREILTVAPFTESIKAFNYCNIIVEMLKQFIKENDVQSSVSMALVLGDRIRPHLNEKLFDFWVTSYIDKLNDFKLFICSTDVHNSYQPNQPQASTSIRLSCSLCCRILKQGWMCRRCPDKNRTNFIHVCALCHLPVKGHYIWCQGCCHGGHYNHLTQWFLNHKECPTGCGHLCEYN